MPGETARSEAQRVEATRHCSRRTETRNLIASFCIESPSSILWIWYASFRRSSLGSSVDCTRTCVGGSRGVVGRAGCALQISRMPAYSRVIPPTSPPGSRVVGDGGWFTVYPPARPPHMDRALRRLGSRTAHRLPCHCCSLCICEVEAWRNCGSYRPVWVWRTGNSVRCCRILDQKNCIDSDRATNGVLRATGRQIDLPAC